MNRGARITALGRALRLRAGEMSGDINERYFLAHCALVHILSEDPALERIDPNAPSGERGLRVALFTAHLATRSAAAQSAASRRALLAP